MNRHLSMAMLMTAGMVFLPGCTGHREAGLRTAPINEAVVRIIATADSAHAYVLDPYYAGNYESADRRRPAGGFIRLLGRTAYATRDLGPVGENVNRTLVKLLLTPRNYGTVRPECIYLYSYGLRYTSSAGAVNVIIHGDCDELSFIDDEGTIMDHGMIARHCRRSWKRSIARLPAG